MKRINYSSLKDDFFAYEEFADIRQVQTILQEIKKNGDRALREYTLKFDGEDIKDFRIPKEKIQLAYQKVNRELIGHIKKAAHNIERFAEKQIEPFKNFQTKIEPGVTVGQRVIPIHRVGVYVPGGRFPLISSLIMGVVPAKEAGVPEVIVCSPPATQGHIHPAILVAADIVGVDEIYQAGGAQAIGAMAYGTESIRGVDKIVGAGNTYVTMAKKMVFGAVGIDLLAGPTEVLIIADETANPEYVAADLIAQAEHDPNARAILATPSTKLSIHVLKEIETQLKKLKTHKTAREALEKNGMILMVKDISQAVTFANRKAPEHLELQVADAKKLIPRLKNYGSLFVGEYTAEVLGDYTAGLNHTLPTNFAARYTGGLSVKDFLKIQTTLEVNRQGLDRIGPAAEGLARAEGLMGHVQSVSLRLKSKK